MQEMLEVHESAETSILARMQIRAREGGELLQRDFGETVFFSSAPRGALRNSASTWVES